MDADWTFIALVVAPLMLILSVNAVIMVLRMLGN